MRPTNVLQQLEHHTVPPATHAPGLLQRKVPSPFGIGSLHPGLVFDVPQTGVLPGSQVPVNLSTQSS